MTFDQEYFNLGYLDRLSYKDTVIHRLDPRAKLIATLGFIVTVVSYPKYEVVGLFPFFIFPALFFSLGDIPVKFILKKVLLVSFFAIFIGIFNPILDRQPLHTLHGISISQGWISLLSIMLKFFLTVTSGLLLIATTSFPGICNALQRLGLPEIFSSQLLFLYRYLFVLAEETMKVARARDIRSVGKQGQGMKIFINIAGILLIRTVERAERIYHAMLSRGFTGTLHSVQPYHFLFKDAFFLAATIAALIIFRMYDLVGVIGIFAVKVL